MPFKLSFVIVFHELSCYKLDLEFAFLSLPTSYPFHKPFNDPGDAATSHYFLFVYFRGFFIFLVIKSLLKVLCLHLVHDQNLMYFKVQSKLFFS